MILAWLIANSHWLIPSLGWGYSEYRGWKSGGEKASVSQIVWDGVKFAAQTIGSSNKPPGSP